MVTALPETVHTLSVFDAKLTGIPFGAPPDIAVALTVNGAAPNVTSGNELKVMVCEAPVTLKLRVTGAGAAQFAAVAWLAVTVHCPTDTSESALPDTVQTAGVSEA
jgi:hypothetical protein